jgi:hypothetical protein
MDGEAVAEKVYIRGVDDLSTADVKGFADEHYPSVYYNKIEWIDDTSANIVYSSADAALEALEAFSVDTNAATIPPLTERIAKKLSTHPEIDLVVRQSKTTDVKKPRAHEASRYYLMNPDKDPRERRKQRVGKRYGREERGESRKRQQPDEEEQVKWTEDMYDDPPLSPKINGKRESHSSLSDSDERRRKRVRFNGRDGDLFADRMDNRGTSGRLRNRSASPGSRAGADRLSYRDDSTSARIRRRSLTPPARQQPVRELFPSKAPDLFADRLAQQGKPKELFPHRTSISNHRRTDAVDASDETSPQPFPKPEKPRDLFDRIESKGSTALGRLASDSMPARPRSSPTEMGFAVHGAASQGLSIKGAGNKNTTVKELFPNKFSNANDLFAEKLKGRGGPRKKAEDLFG